MSVLEYKLQSNSARQSFDVRILGILYTFELYIVLGTGFVINFKETSKSEYIYTGKFLLSGFDLLSRTNINARFVYIHPSAVAGVPDTTNLIDGTFFLEEGQ